MGRNVASGIKLLTRVVDLEQSLALEYLWLLIAQLHMK